MLTVFIVLPSLCFLILFLSLYIRNLVVSNNVEVLDDDVEHSQTYGRRRCGKSFHEINYYRYKVKKRR